MPALATAQVVGEDRTLTIQDGQFADGFAAYGVHIYKITAASARDTTPNTPRQ
jgi:hypothetical protein